MTADDRQPAGAPMTPDDLQRLPDERLQELLAGCVREYARRARHDGAPAPFPGPDAVTDTEVVVAVRAMLAVRAIAPFEVAMAPIDR